VRRWLAAAEVAERPCCITNHGTCCVVFGSQQLLQGRQRAGFQHHVCKKHSNEFQSLALCTGAQADVLHFAFQEAQIKQASMILIQKNSRMKLESSKRLENMSNH
jgi:hypothetical protein